MSRNGNSPFPGSLRRSANSMQCPEDLSNAAIAHVAWSVIGGTSSSFMIRSVLAVKKSGDKGIS